MKIRKGDMVKVITGKENGKTGKVLLVDMKHGTVLVEKINFVKRHQKPTQKQRQGGVIEKEAPLHISNVMFYEEKEGKASRVGFKFEGDKKLRISRKTGNAVEVGK